MTPSEFASPAAPGVYSVSTLTGEIQRLLTRNFDGIQVAGEISGWKVWTSGHAYFALKDAHAQIRCVLFRNTLRYLRIKPQEGMQVVIRGNVEVRSERGEYQLIVSGMEAQGQGRLYELFEQLKEKLRAEGLFDSERKRPLPIFPQRIGIVTSPQGAVIRDMLSVLRRRWPGLHIRLYPTAVQGTGSVEGIVAGLEHFSASEWAEVVIVGRGGGSIEDLWSFNDERVARAIVASRPPVISAVGHETDFTIADFAADLRAPTPSAAAEIVVLERNEVAARAARARQHSVRGMQLRLSEASRRLEQRGVERAARLLQLRINRLQQRTDESEIALKARIAAALGPRRQGLEQLRTRLLKQDLSVKLAQAGERRRVAARSLCESMQRRIVEARRRHEPLSARLQALSPLSVLERGYSIVQTADGHVVKRAEEAPAGTPIEIRLHRGRLAAEVQRSVPEGE